MPMPKFSQLASAATERRKELSQPLAGSEVLGTIPADSPLTDPTPQGSSAAWQSDSGTIEIEETPPPWEQAGGGYDMSDASRFVKAPANVVLRWKNPKLVQSLGYDNWHPVSASDERFQVLVTSMVAPDNTIRRGGHEGDILVWNLRSWVESRRAEIKKRTEAISASAVNKQDELREQFSRGTFGKIRLEEAKHPTHTNLEGRTIKD